MNKIQMEKWNGILLNKQNEAEMVSEDTLENARAIVDRTIPVTTTELFTYCAALNVLNTYVKQYRHRISYYFKGCVDSKVVPFLIHNNDSDVVFNYTIDKGMKIIYISFDGIIMSFHQVVLSSLHEQQLKKAKGFCPELQFDGIRKQKCAETLFHMATSLQKNCYSGL